MGLYVSTVSTKWLDNINPESTLQKQQNENAIIT